MAISSKADPAPLGAGPSLRHRLLLLSAVTIAAALGLAGLALGAVFDRHLDRRVAQELQVKLLELAGAFALDASGAPVLTRALSDPRYEQPNSGTYWQVSDADGAVLRSRSLWEHRLRHDDPRGALGEAYRAPGPEASVLDLRERDVRLGAGGVPRAFRLTVALDHAELEALGDSFRTDVLLSLAVIACALLLGAWAQLAVGLAPLRRLQDQIGRIRQGRAERLAGTFPAEVAPLAESLNALIDRQEDGVRRARERAGDLAHGLKTPLAVVAAEARRLEAGGDSSAAGRLHDQVAQMRAHVQRQLARARSHGASAAGGTATDAAPAVERLLALMRRLPRGEHIAWRNAVPSGLRLRMDAEDFSEVMGNLLDNARLWAGSAVMVSAAPQGGRFRISVEDDGPGFGPGFGPGREPVRGESGAPPGEGNGLGLAIVGDVLALYGTRLEIGASASGGGRVGFVAEGWEA